MTKTLSLCFILSIAAICTPPELTAAPAGQLDRTFEVMSLDDLPLGIFYDTHPQPKAVDIPNGYFSPVQTLHANGSELTFFMEIPPPASAPAGTPPQRKDLAKIELPSDASDFLVFLKRAAPGSALPLKGIAIDAQGKKHTAGTVRLINLSTFTAGLSLSGQPTEIPPGTTDYLAKYSPGAVNLIVGIQTKNGWDQAFQTRRQYDANYILSVILFNHAPTIEDPNPVRVIYLSRYDRSKLLTDNASH